MDAYDRYLEYEDKIYELKDEGKWDEADKLEDEQLAIRNNEFTRKDWERLIDEAKFDKRAVFEYTRMMNAKFPAEDEAMRLFGLHK